MWRTLFGGQTSGSILTFVTCQFEKPSGVSEVGPDSGSMANGIDHLKRVDLPNLLQRFLRPGDLAKPLLRSGGAVLIERFDSEHCLLYAPIGYVS